MLDVFNTPNKVGANVQYFYQDGSWTKPRGASQIYMLLIGGGGNGDGTIGGGCGAISVWFGNANHVPDCLIIHPSNGNANDTTISYIGTTTSVLLSAKAADGSAAGSVTTATLENQFVNSGFFQAVAGQIGTNVTVTQSATTFLSAGSGSTVTANYGYATSSATGFFMLQPVIVGTGSSGSSPRNGAIGCGGSSNASSLGGRGLVIIASY